MITYAHRACDFANPCNAYTCFHQRILAIPRSRFLDERCVIAPLNGNAQGTGTSCLSIIGIQLYRKGVEGVVASFSQLVHRAVGGGIGLERVRTIIFDAQSSVIVIILGRISCDGIICQYIKCGCGFASTQGGALCTYLHLAACRGNTPHRMGIVPIIHIINNNIAVGFNLMLTVANASIQSGIILCRIESTSCIMSGINTHVLDRHSVTGRTRTQKLRRIINPIDSQANILCGVCTKIILYNHGKSDTKRTPLISVIIQCLHARSSIIQFEGIATTALINSQFSIKVPVCWS